MSADDLRDRLRRVGAALVRLDEAAVAALKPLELERIEKAAEAFVRVVAAGCQRLANGVPITDGMLADPVARETWSWVAALAESEWRAGAPTTRLPDSGTLTEVGAPASDSLSDALPWWEADHLEGSAANGASPGASLDRGEDQ